jgi:hypothetical protein
MEQVAGITAWRIGWLCIAVLSAGFGCAYTPVQPPTPHQSLPESRQVEPSAQVQIEQPGEHSGWRGQQKIRMPSGEPIAVVLDDQHNAHLEMLQVFSARLGHPYRIFNLAHRSPESIQLSLRHLAPIKVIALGSAAFETTATLAGVDVFFAGVLDPGRTTQGIDALPPFATQLDYWHSLAPGIKRLGVVASPALAWRVDALAVACADRGITLERRVVRSDKETQFAFRSMVPHIDGFVFLPDPEVLSPAVMQEVMRHGRRNDVQILVYSPVMFNLGATLFLQPHPVEVAVAVIELIEDPRGQQVVVEMRTRSRLGRGLLVGGTNGDSQTLLALARAEPDDG